MKTFSKYLTVIASFLCITTSSCKKQDDFLNVKQNISQVTPSSLKDFQAVMDNTPLLNENFSADGVGMTDNLFIPDANLATLPQTTRNMYLWVSDIYQGQPGFSWNADYQIIEICNIVLDGLKKLDIPTDQTSLSQYNNVKGTALFFRAFAFYMLADEYCKPYISKTASADLGIVLRLTSDVTQKSVRSTVQQTYDQILTDAQTALQLLPLTPTLQTRPSQPAAYGLLAKVYLAMSDYQHAGSYATQSLKQFNTLLDFNSNSVKPGANGFPVYPNNPEISFWAYGTGDGQVSVYPGSNYSSVDMALYNSYDQNDLRKTCFYAPNSFGGYSYCSSYISTFYVFAGIATDEILLIQAECDARLNDTQDALADLNMLLVKRYKTGTYVPFTNQDPTVLLNKILLERRKELPFTGSLRWEDLRRLNQDPNFAITLTRISNGKTFTLPPNDPRYVLPIPDIEIQLSGIQQNQR